METANIQQPRVVGICGSAGAGKSTVANYLVDNHGFIRTRFADPMKDIGRALGLSERQVDGDLKEVPTEILTHDNFGELIGKTKEAFSSIGIELPWGDGAEKIPLLYNRSEAFVVSAFIGVLARIVAKGESTGGATPRLLLQYVGAEFGRELINKNIWTDLWLNNVKALLANNANVVCDDLRFPNEYDLIHQLGGLVIEIRRPANALDVGIHESEQHRFEPDAAITNEEGDLASLFSQVDEAIGLRSPSVPALQDAA